MGSARVVGFDGGEVLLHELCVDIRSSGSTRRAVSFKGHLVLELASAGAAIGRLNGLTMPANDARAMRARPVVLKVNHVGVACAHFVVRVRLLRDGGPLPERLAMRRAAAIVDNPRCCVAELVQKRTAKLLLTVDDLVLEFDLGKADFSTALASNSAPKTTHTHTHTRGRNEPSTTCDQQWS